MKRYYKLAAAAVLSLCVFGGCSSSSNSGTSSGEAEQARVLNLDGVWKQTNSNSEDIWQEATISGTTIEVNWVQDDGNTTMIYWVGSYEPPTEDLSEYTWDSIRDAEATDNALLASTDDEKTFTYKDNVISYKVSMMGVTTTVEMQRVEN